MAHVPMCPTKLIEREEEDEIEFVLSETKLRSYKRWIRENDAKEPTSSQQHPIYRSHCCARRDVNQRLEAARTSKILVEISSCVDRCRLGSAQRE